MLAPRASSWSGTKLTADQAFTVLAQVSQELNRKLIDIARELTDTGAMPGGNRRRD